MRKGEEKRYKEKMQIRLHGDSAAFGASSCGLAVAQAGTLALENTGVGGVSRVAVVFCWRASGVGSAPTDCGDGACVAMWLYSSHKTETKR